MQTEMNFTYTKDPETVAFEGDAETAFVAIGSVLSVMLDGVELTEADALDLINEACQADFSIRLYMEKDTGTSGIESTKGNGTPLLGQILMCAMELDVALEKNKEGMS